MNGWMEWCRRMGMGCLCGLLVVSGLCGAAESPCRTAGGATGAAESPCFAVGAFTSAAETFPWKGETGSCAAWGQALAVQLRGALVRNGLKVSTNASWCVSGTVDFSGDDPLVLSLRTQVRDVASGKVRVQDELTLETGFFAVTNLVALVAATTETAAQTVADRLAVRFRPFRILVREADGRYVVGAGFGTLRVGECLTVFSPGAKPVALGTVQIVEVAPTKIRAVLIEREGAEIPLGAPIRRVPLVGR